MAKLTDKHRLFVEEYVLDGDHVRAAVAAGYSLDVARHKAKHMLAVPEIAAAIGRARRAVSERAMRRARKTKDDVMSELTEVAFTPVRVVTGGEKLRALAMLGQEQHGIFKDGDGTGAVKVNLTINSKTRGTAT